jgi:hypothetical protein
MRYSYALGRLLDDRNTYAYPDVENPDFLDSWRRERALTLERLSGRIIGRDGPIADVGPAVGLFDAVATCPENNLNGFDRIVHRFELTKRVWPEYDSDGKPIAAADFRNIDLYVFFARALVAAAQRTGSLVYLNALLKVVDTCCAYVDEVDAIEELRAVIEAERELLDGLAAS